MQSQVQQQLNKAALMALYQSATDAIQNDAALQLCHDQLVVQMAAFVDDLDRSTDMKLGLIENYSAADGVSAADMLAFGCWFAWKNCSPCSCRFSHVPNDRYRIPISNFLLKIANYAVLFDYLIMCFAGDATAERMSDGSVNFWQANKVNRQVQCADHYSKNLQPGDFPTPRRILLSVARICRHKHTGVGAKALYYQRTSATIREMCDFLRPFYQNLRQFHNVVIPASYSLDDFNEVWIGLVGIAMFHGRMTRGFRKTHPLQFLASADIVLSRKRWILLLHKVTGLPGNVINAVLSDITYDGSAYSRPDRAPMPPFIALGNRLLLLNRVTLVASAEQDLYRLFELFKLQTNTAMKKHKEMLQLERLRVLFRQIDVTVYGPFKNVQFNGQKTDLDAVLFDPKKRLLVCAQLKWPAQPRWRKDYSTAANELTSALHQTDISLGWLQTAPQSVRQALNLTNDQFKKLTIRGLVISARTLAGGLVRWRNDIPITNEYLLHAIIKAVWKADLDNVWQFTKSGKLLPIENIDFSLMDLSGELDGTQFIFKNGLAFPVRWLQLRKRLGSDVFAEYVF